MQVTTVNSEIIVYKGKELIQTVDHFTNFNGRLYAKFLEARGIDSKSKVEIRFKPIKISRS